MAPDGPRSALLADGSETIETTVPGAETILSEAERIIYGEGPANHGHPKDNFRRIAKLWRAYFAAKGQGAVSLDEEDVARLMILFKIARDLHSPLRDNAVDMAGYAGTLDRLREP